MQFQLPQNLLKQVVAYDPVLKPVYQPRVASKTSKTGKPRLGIGVIDCLIPTDLIDARTQLLATTELNHVEAADRHWSFENDKCVAVITHHTSQFMAWWYPKTISEQHNYLYGFSLAFKDTPATIGKFDDDNMHLGWKKDAPNPSTGGTHWFLDIAKRSEVKTDRSKFILKTVRITEEQVRNGLSSIPMQQHMNRYGVSLRKKLGAVYNWIRSFTDTIPSWKDEPWYVRIQEGGDIRKCVFQNASKLVDNPEISFVDLLVHQAIYYGNSEMGDATYRVLQTPYFKKEANKVFDKTLKAYSDSDTAKRVTVMRPYLNFKNKVSVLQCLLKVYDDASLDYCQQVWELADELPTFRMPQQQGARDWLKTNLPISSFIQILSKKAEEHKSTDSSEYPRTHTLTPRMHDWNDCTSMLDQLQRHQNKHDETAPLELARPNRWRIKEFHDYLVAECFKISTPNEKLPQDLFPQPIRIEHNDHKWSFFQPCDVHQLAAWGNAVRNCVGSADNYRKGIKSKTHFIVLVMLNGEPRYTVQAKVSNGVLNIEQIADVCNRNLKTGQRDIYQQVFGQALNKRAAELPQQQESTELEIAQ